MTPHSGFITFMQNREALDSPTLNRLCKRGYCLLTDLKVSVQFYLSLTQNNSLVNNSSIVSPYEHYNWIYLLYTGHISNVLSMGDAGRNAQSFLETGLGTGLFSMNR